MKPGATRIVAGAVLTTLLALGTVRDVIVLLVLLARTGATPSWLGALIGSAVLVVLLVLSVRLLRSGLRLRRAWWTTEALEPLRSPLRSTSKV